MAILIKADGKCELKIPANHLAFTLAELQEAVGGYVEAVAVKGHSEWLMLLVDEDAKDRKKRPNRQASLLAAAHVVGDALLLTMDEWNASMVDDGPTAA